MKLENLMYKSEEKEKIYTIGDLKGLSTSVLYGFDPSRPIGSIHVTPLSSINFPDFSSQFSLLDNYGKKEEEKSEWSLLDAAKVIKEQYDKENKKSEPLNEFKFSGHKLIIPYGNLGIEGLEDAHDTFETDRSKNPNIQFVVQSSLTKIPFIDKSIDTIILSMVLHHLRKREQKKMIKNLISYLSKNGRIILIEDTFPEKINLKEFDKTTENFLKFKKEDKKKILYFYDWFGNRLMRNRDNIPLFYDYRTMEEWKKIFEKYGMKQIKSEFIKINPSHPDIFPPKAIIIFQRKKLNTPLLSIEK